MISASVNSSTVSRRRLDTAAVLRELEQLHSSLKVGDTFPSRRELMERLNAPEHVVRGALVEFQRQGKIIQRVGRGGSFVAEFDAQNNGYLATHNGNLQQSQSQSRTVVVIATPDHSFFDRAVEMLFDQAEKAELSLVCRPFNPQKSELPSDENSLGYILFRSDLLPLAQRLHKSGHRVVLIGTPAKNESFHVPTVKGDQERGGYLATKHLLDLGHRRIAFRGGATMEAFLDSPRGKGQQKAIDEVRREGHDIQASFIFDAEFDKWKLRTASAIEFWSRRDAPTAVSVWNDHEAVYLMEFLSYIGVNVPNQVSIVGYDNLPEAARAYPALSSIDCTLEYQLQAALDILMAPEPLSSNHTVVVLPTLVSRNSTASV